MLRHLTMYDDQIKHRVSDRNLTQAVSVVDRAKGRNAGKPAFLFPDGISDLFTTHLRLDEITDGSR